MAFKQAVACPQSPTKNAMFNIKTNGYLFKTNSKQVVLSTIKENLLNAAM
ncbi:hypothetical protein MTO98_04045 [Mucilaginibacter sp. SMC90]|nr:hypothetical protein [Mucilaginibacter sp. SMC90]UOE50242.1 hypothetical protein MTO98_04045 [Mucilaginibacter sp. SMC90]